MPHFLSVLFAQAAAGPVPDIDVPWYHEGWFTAALALVVIVVPFLIGSWLAKRLRMSDYGWRIGLILFSLVAGLVICWRGWPPRLGIDLSGGVILVYEIDQSKTGVDAATIADRIRRSLNDLPDADATVTVNADGRIEVTLPGADSATTQKVEKQVGRTNLTDVESAIVVQARPIRDGKQVLVYDVRRTGSTDMEKMVSTIGRRINPGGQKEVTVRRMGADRVEVIIPQVDQSEINFIKEKISTAGALKFRILANAVRHADVIALAQQTDAHDVMRGDKLVAQWVLLDPEKFDEPRKYAGHTVRKNKRGELETLVIIDPYDVGGQYLTRASAGYDQYGRPDVNFNFNSQGAVRFGQLTSTHLPDKNSSLEYQLGIVLDNRLMSAPNIKSTITSSGQISGDFSEQEVKAIVDILNAGSLPAALSKVPVAEYTSSAQLGSDTIRYGAMSMVVATIAILIFMQVYYKFAGFVANAAVLMNLVLVMALMILIKAHLTLAGLAGLVLSVGMAVDANVLIYERMREETERGAALRMAIRNGFGRAMATIIDSHCTTLITGIVLYVIGTDQLRGFATTLILGLLLNLYTAVYCSRVVFDIAERQRWLKQLRMMKLFGKTNFDFVRWMPRWMALTVIVSILGLGGAVAREMGWFGGAGLFGIDFTGGISVQVVFNKPTDIAAVREAVKELPDASVTAVTATQAEQRNTTFVIDTSFQAEQQESKEETIKLLEDRLKKLFPGQLKMYSMEYSFSESKDSDASAPAAGQPAANRAEAVAQLKFPDKISYVAVQGMIAKAFADMSLPETGYEVTSPDKDFEPGSSRPIENWVVTASLPQAQLETVLKDLQKNLADTAVFPSANVIGGKVAGDTKVTALYALVISNILVALYIWIRFQNLIFGMAAIVALLHDVLIAIAGLSLSYWLAGPLGFLQIAPFKITLDVVAALLTIVGYSINDTIVVFDRIREIRGKSPDLTPTMINQAINQTLSRTILTSGTVFLVTAILYWLGGEGVHAFAFVMLIGVLTGTYSSVFIAAPILLWFKKPTATTTAAVRKATASAVPA